ncbi:MAG: crossover junction endodeoxyribonuclease RuvC [Bacteroidota bacterium]
MITSKDKEVNKDRIILGIDPGTNMMGYGLLHVQKNKPSLIALGVLNLSKYDDHALKLKKIFECMLGIIDQYLPDELSIEAPFFGKNVQSMLKLGRAQGVAIAAAVYRNIPITEYQPRKIKQAITGNGSASKEQVAAMLKSILYLKHELDGETLDATDALGAAVCHYLQNNKVSGKKSYSGWGAFIKDNPDKIKKV